MIHCLAFLLECCDFVISGLLLVKNDRMLQFQGCCLAIPLECLDSRAVAGCGSRAVSGCVAWIVLAVLSECWNVRMLWFCPRNVAQFVGAAPQQPPVVGDCVMHLRVAEDEGHPSNVTQSPTTSSW